MTIIAITCRVTQPPKIVVKLLENLPTFKTNGTVIQQFLGNMCSFEQLFYRNKSLGAPDTSDLGTGSLRHGYASTPHFPLGPLTQGNRLMRVKITSLEKKSCFVYFFK